jgi:hypothetical protein
MDQLLAQSSLLQRSQQESSARFVGLSLTSLCSVSNRAFACNKTASRVVSDQNAHTRTFRLAIETLGSAERLAKALGASVAEVEAWTRGHARPPPGAFLKAIDVVAQAGWRSPDSFN